MALRGVVRGGQFVNFLEFVFRGAAHIPQRSAGADGTELSLRAIRHGNADSRPLRLTETKASGEKEDGEQNLLEDERSSRKHLPPVPYIATMYVNQGAWPSRSAPCST